ncbi:MAG: L-gulono,4-lactone dehydrogenase [Pseudonocardiales bacterium]|nr:L-gulono,4-lactone dehydrogenase [Pseudonocardiales bacterium]
MSRAVQGEWRNWAGNQRATPSQVVTPASVAELSAVIGAAARAGRRVKAIGSGHSFTGVGLTDGVQVNLARLSGLRALDSATGLVTVEAGMPLYRLNRLLEDAGLALSNLGDIDRQTLAGALSTGTHGTGRNLGGLATQVRALELVLADGSVVHCDANQDAELFSAARVGLGALGVVTAVTLATEPAFALHAAERPMSLTQVLGELDELVATNEHFEFYWFPHTDKTLTKRNNRLAAGEQPRPLGPRRAFIEDDVIGNGAFRLTCELGRAVPALVPRINQFAARFMGDREYSDASHRVFCSPRRVRFVEMEYAVPRAAVRDAIAGVQRVTEQPGMKVSFPIEVRFAAPDDIPLSTASGRESAYLAVHMFAGQPYQRYFADVEAVMSGLDGRPHWGKMHTCDAATLRTRYPRFDEFLAVRKRADPAGVFSNDYTDRVLGPVDGGSN